MRTTDAKSHALAFTYVQKQTNSKVFQTILQGNPFVPLRRGINVVQKIQILRSSSSWTLRFPIDNLSVRRRGWQDYQAPAKEFRLFRRESHLTAPFWLAIALDDTMIDCDRLL